MLRQPPAVRVSADPTLIPWVIRLMASARPARADAATRLLRELAVDSVRLHCELASDGLNPTLRKTGAIDVDFRRRGRPRKSQLPLSELRSIEPTLGEVYGGSHDTEEWTVESRSFVSAMLDDAVAFGADLLMGTPALKLMTQDDCVVGVRVPGGALSANHVVLAAGLHSAALASGVGLTLPLRGGRGYVVDLAPDPGRDPVVPVRIKKHRVVVTPLADRVRVCGSIEFGEENRPVRPARGEALVQVAKQALPMLSGRPMIDRWAGERPCTPDGVPVIGQSTQVANLSVATGHGMWGLILAPVTARLTADAITNRGRSSPDHAWLSPDRFGPRKKQPLAG